MIRTVLVDDSGSMRKAIRTLLDTTPDIRVVGEASDGAEGIHVVRALRPDVVLMDLHMPGTDGLDAIETLCGVGVKEPVPVLVLTSFHIDDYLFGALERGAVGFLLKKNPGDIPAAARAAVNAHALTSPQVRERMVATFARDAGRHAHRSRRAEATPSGLKDVLTGRELEVVTALADGLSNKQIAHRLDLSENTVKWHIAKMLSKTESADRTQLVLWAVSRGLNP